LILRKLLTPLGKGKSPTVASLVNYGTNWGAVALAGFCNFYTVRKGELVTGIKVKEMNSEDDFGMSQVAAKDAIVKACIARFMYTFPMFFVPVAFNALLSKVNLLPRTGSKVRILTEIIGVGTGLYIAMGVNCSIYPQFVAIDVSKLEPDIRAKAEAKGIKTLYFNKGI
jgi:hypothetical protein